MSGGKVAGETYGTRGRALTCWRSDSGCDYRERADGGACLTMSAFDAFYFGMVNGRGWIAVASLFCVWRPSKAPWRIVFGHDAYQVRASSLLARLFYQFFLMLPYLLSIMAMVVAAKARYPKPYLPFDGVNGIRVSRSYGGK